MDKYDCGQRELVAAVLSLDERIANETWFRAGLREFSGETEDVDTADTDRRP